MCVHSQVQAVTAGRKWKWPTSPEHHCNWRCSHCAYQDPLDPSKPEIVTVKAAAHFKAIFKRNVILFTFFLNKQNKYIIGKKLSIICSNVLRVIFINTKGIYFLVKSDSILFDFLIA